MNEASVVDLLEMTKEIGVDVWIDGGWGVDALIGRQTREHDDIDFFVQKKDATAFVEMLTSTGYCETMMDYTSDDHTAWRDSVGRTVDLHLFEFEGAESLRFENEIYPSSILGGKGEIGGVPVQCLTVEAQLQYHQGYEPDEKDALDVALLCKTFGLPIPDCFVSIIVSKGLT